MQPTVLSFEDARRAVEQAAAQVHPPEAERCELLLAGGRVLAESVLADRDFPPFARATRDGYAVRSADVSSVPARLKLVGEIRAGGPPQSLDVKPGQAVEIMTGAPVPAGTDAVVMVEYTLRAGDAVEIQRCVAAGENFVPTGAEAKRGEVLLCPGTRLTPAAVAVAGSCGRRQLRVYKRPRVAILSTGDELVDIAAEPAPNQIRNSNSYSLAAQVHAAGGVPGRARGQLALLEQQQLAPADLRQVVEHAGADHAAADDDRPGFIPHGAMISPPAAPRAAPWVPRAPPPSRRGT